jgi:hypothetical protein
MKNGKNKNDKDVKPQGSNKPLEIEETVYEGGSESSLGAAGNEAKAAIGSGAFTAFWTWRGNGTVKAMKFSHASIKASSRVFVSLSEYSSDANVNRFIGDCRMDVYNVAPFNGGFFAWVEVPWSYPLNVRFDVFVDP